MEEIILTKENVTAKINELVDNGVHLDSVFIEVRDTFCSTYLDKPVKPSMPKEFNSKVAAEYSKALEIWEIEMINYNHLKDVSRLRDKIVSQGIKDFIFEYSGLNKITSEVKREKIWNKACEDHSGGYYSVYQEVENILDFFFR